jgi:PAS domain S-box-containing protein
MIPPKPTGKAIEFYKGNVIYEIDTKGYITYVNRSFLTVSQYDRADVLGVHYTDIIDPHMPRTLFQCMQESTKNGDTWQGYVKNLRADGAHYWSVAFVSPKKNEVDEIIGYTSMYKAMTQIAIDEMTQTYERIYHLEQEGKETCGLIKNIHVV